MSQVLQPSIRMNGNANVLSKPSWEVFAFRICLILFFAPLAFCFSATQSHADSYKIPDDGNSQSSSSPSAEGGLNVIGLKIVPDEIQITHRDAWQTIQLQKVDESGEVVGEFGQGEVEWKIDDENIASIENDGVNPVKVVARGTGSATLTATVNAGKGKPSILVQWITTPVRVIDGDTPTAWGFNNHAQSILSRNGCNQGACHGTLSGKGGFRLSLRAYDAAQDYFNITQQDRGRRIELSDPEKSLLLAKPSGDIEHKGGLRLPKESHDYRVLRDWIIDGCKDTIKEEPKLKNIEVLPELVQLKVGDYQNVIVRAHYDDGHIEDVTHWAKYSSADESIALVDAEGKATIVGPGEGAIGVWFASRVAASRIRVRFADRDPNDKSPWTVANVIDEDVNRQLESLGLQPAAKCNDHEFIRRVFLDTIGTLPTKDETIAFAAESAEDKRERLIEGLLDRPEFVDYWTYRWSDLLMLNGQILRADAVKSYYNWIRKHVADNTAWDVLVREIVTARGEALENGAVNFYAINQDPESMTENSCQAFLGLSIGCAKCHNHPLEKWTNNQYYAMANMFSRVRTKGWAGDPYNGDGAKTLVVLDRGELIQPSTGKPQLPAPLDSPSLDPSDAKDRRIALAEWMTSPDNPYFTKAIVNRIWAAYFGIGIVNSVDDLRSSNPASNPALMDSLCRHLVDHKYDLKSTMRLILNSETYQRSSLTNASNEKDRKYFSHYYPKRLMAEVLHDAVVQVSEITSDFKNIESQSASLVKSTDFYKPGTRAIQLYDSAVVNTFLKTFGRNQRRITCECERSDDPSIIQVLHINNGETLNPKLAKEGSSVDVLIKSYSDQPRMLISQAFLTALSREPTTDETDALEKEILAATPETLRIVVEDLLWSLMSTREFLFNH